MAFNLLFLVTLCVAGAAFQGTFANDLTTCRKTVGGAEYIGTISQTADGKTCQRWDSQAPHEHTRTDPDNFPDDTLAEAENYCRNPDGDNAPWCYTTDPDDRWDYCDIPVCVDPMLKKCKITEAGTEYVGTISKNADGKTCQRWDSQSPHEHTRNNPVKFPDDTLAEAENYCRNPDGENRPWCYTTDPDDRWNYCDIQYCNDDTCKKDVKGLDYSGTLSYTKTGKTCQRWDTQTPHEHTRNDPKLFPDDTVSEADNFCRNPDNEAGGPWCYTTDPDSRWEYCDIDICGDKSVQAPTPTQAPVNPCPLAKEVGSCSDLTTRYFYKAGSNKCDKFQGCADVEGRNNFATLSECQITCAAWTMPPECLLPVDAGSGDGKNDNYYYVKETGKCKRFTYNGNGGNDNRFDSKNDCAARCKNK